MNSTKYVFYTAAPKHVILAEALDTVLGAGKVTSAAKKDGATAVFKALLANIDTILALPSHEASALLSHSFTALSEVPRESTASLVQSLAAALSSPAAAAKDPIVQLGLLGLLFNTFDTDSILRGEVFLPFLRLARAAGLGARVVDHLPHVAAWSQQWLFNASQLAEINKLAADAYLTAGNPAAAQQHLVAYITHLGTPAAAAAEGAEFVKYASLAAAFSVKAPAPTVTLSNDAAYDVLLSLPAFAALAAADVPVASQGLHQLLGLLLNGSVTDYLAWAKTPAAAAAAAEFGLDTDAVLLNVRALALTAVLTEGSNIAFDVAATAACPDDVAAVEEHLIDIISLGQVTGRLNERTRTLRVDSFVPRAFDGAKGPTAWAALAARVDGWHAAVDAAIKEAPEVITKSTLV